MCPYGTLVSSIALELAQSASSSAIRRKCADSSANVFGGSVRTVGWVFPDFCVPEAMAVTRSSKVWPFADIFVSLVFMVRPYVHYFSQTVFFLCEFEKWTPIHRAGRDYFVHPNNCPPTNLPCLELREESLKRTNRAGVRAASVVKTCAILHICFAPNAAPLLSFLPLAMVCWLGCCCSPFASHSHSCE